jgi:hypothetical protein
LRSRYIGKASKKLNFLGLENLIKIQSKKVELSHRKLSKKQAFLVRKLPKTG